MITVLFALLALIDTNAPSEKSAGQIRHDETAAAVKAGKIQFYPQKAQAAGGITGEVTLNCLVDADGWLDDCAVAKEMPSGFGFGASALTMSPLYHYKSKVPGQAIVPHRQDVPIHFKLSQ